jgi:hypothetical protein
MEPSLTSKLSQLLQRLPSMLVISLMLDFFVCSGIGRLHSDILSCCMIEACFGTMADAFD